MIDVTLLKNSDKSSEKGSKSNSHFLPLPEEWNIAHESQQTHNPLEYAFECLKP